MPDERKTQATVRHIPVDLWLNFRHLCLDQKITTSQKIINLIAEAVKEGKKC